MEDLDSKKTVCDIALEVALEEAEEEKNYIRMCSNYNKKDYVSLNVGELKAGDLVFVELKNIFGTELQPEHVVDKKEDKNKEVCEYQEVFSLDKFQHDFYRLEFDKKEPFKKIMDSNYIILLKYLGEGKFLEYYTQNTIQYIDFTSRPTKYNDASEFMKEYKYAYNHPLYITKHDLLPYTSERMEKLFKQDICNKEIINCINNMYNWSRTQLEQDINTIMLQDERFAYEENEIYDYQNSKLKR